MLWVYGFYKYFNSFSAGNVFIRQNRTSTDVRFCRRKCFYTSGSDVYRRQILKYKNDTDVRFLRIKSVPALKGLINQSMTAIGDVSNVASDMLTASKELAGIAIPYAKQ